MATLTKAGHTVTLHDAGPRERCRAKACQRPSMAQVVAEARKRLAVLERMMK